VIAVAMIIGASLLWSANRAQPVEPQETVTEQPAVGSRPVAA
jgi:hypothetical protein